MFRISGEFGAIPKSEMDGGKVVVTPSALCFYFAFVSIETEVMSITDLIFTNS